MVVHHNRLKLCYGTPQQSTLTQPPPTLTRPSYADAVRHTEPERTGGYTSSSTDAAAATVPVTTRSRRNCGPPSRYNDFVQP